VIKEKSDEECKEWLKKEMKAFNKIVHEKNISLEKSIVPVNY